MRKIILGLVLGCVFIGGNLFAADGDLIVNGGKVGIGTTTPSYPLTVKSSAAGAHILGFNGSGGILYMLGNLFGGNNGHLDLRDSSGNADVRIAANNNSWIMNNLGVGTASPASALDTAGTIRAGSYTYVAPTSGTGVELYYHSASSLGRILAFDRSALAYKDLGLGINSGNQLYLKLGGNVGVGTNNPANLLSVLQYSTTDPVADSWTAYPCDRTTKDVIRTLPNQSGALDRLLAVPLYEWKRKPLVSDEEIKTESEKVMTPDELERKRIELSAAKSNLPKFQAKRVGLMLDDPNIPEEIVSLNGAGQKGIDLVGYIGWLHATIKDLALRVQELEKR